MIRKISRKIGALMISLVLSASVYTVSFGASEPELFAENAVLIEATTGNVLYEKNADQVVYPASITKIVTALVMLDYIDMEEIIVAGSEVDNVPWDSSKAGHQQGESLSGLNLLRGLLLPSGNETGCIVAINVARRETGNDSISYYEAEAFFAELMNDKARELGAVNSNFVNPHGYHDDNHYSTASDIVKICRAALENDFLASVIKETRFSGNGAGDIDTTNLKTQDYTWNTTNQLMIQSSDYYYPYAVGIKTGSTDEAGKCLASAAEKDGKRLIAVVLNSEDPDRWEDSVKLLDYGFNNFKFVTVQPLGEMLGEIILNNPPLGFENTMTVGAESEYIDFFSDDQVARIKQEVVFSESLYTVSEEDGSTKLFNLPIEKNQLMGKVVYTLDGKVIFEDNILAGADVFQRSIITDVQFYFEFIKTHAFTVMALPFWVGGAFLVWGIISIRIKIKRKREKYTYSFDKKRKW